MKVISFNTGRLYTANGQRIKAVQMDDGRIAFVDLDRHIAGVFMEDWFAFTPDGVMQGYDNGWYSLSIPLEALKALKAATI